MANNTSKSNENDTAISQSTLASSSVALPIPNLPPLPSSLAMRGRITMHTTASKASTTSPETIVGSKKSNSQGDESTNQSDSHDSIPLKNNK